MTRCRRSGGECDLRKNLHGPPRAPALHRRRTTTMSATRAQTPASPRPLIGAALGVVLVVGAAPFLRSADAAQPTGDAVAAAETVPVSASGTANDTAVWVNPQDATKAFVLGANGVDGLGVYDMAGAAIDQAGLTAANVTGVDTREGFTLDGSAIS